MRCEHSLFAHPAAEKQARGLHVLLLFLIYIFIFNDSYHYYFKIPFQFSQNLPHGSSPYFQDCQNYGCR